MSYLENIRSGNVFAAMIRGPLAPPYNLTALVVAGLVGITPIDPIESAEWPLTGAVAFRARFVYTWSHDDEVNPPAVLAAFLGETPTALLFAVPWVLPAGFPIAVGEQIEIPIFLSAQPD